MHSRRINHAAGLFIVLAIFLSACHHGGDSDGARVRVGEFLVNTDSARLILVGNEDSTTYQLAYGELSEYRELPAGTYHAQVRAGDQTLIDQSVGLGAGGSFTLLLLGTPLPNQQVNERTLNTVLHRIVEGAAARTGNQYLPQLLIQNDYFVPVPGMGNLRVTHLAPGIVPLDIDVRRDTSSAGTIADLAYPLTSSRDRYIPGNYRLAVHLSGSPLLMQDFRVELRDTTLKSIYLVPDQKASQQLRIVEGVSPNY